MKTKKQTAAAPEQTAAKAPLTVDEARKMSAGDLLAYASDPIAAEQLRLRDQGAAVVRGALAAQGCRYTGTSGWHIAAFASPGGRLGFVNTATGVAVLTSVKLPAQLVAALTVPDQGEGPKVSGAAAWTSPDPGEAHRAAAPAGWVQLVLDLRSGLGDAARVAGLEVWRSPACDHAHATQAEAEACGVPFRVWPDAELTVSVVAWGLRTCYGHQGRPGLMSLEASAGRDGEAARMDPRKWPASPETRLAMDAIGENWLYSAARRLAELCGEEVAQALPPADPALSQWSDTAPNQVAWAAKMAGLRAAWEAQQKMDAGGYDPVKSACCSTSPVVENALREVGLTEVAHAAGDNRRAQFLELCETLLDTALRQRLVRVAAPLWEGLASSSRANQPGYEGRTPWSGAVQSQILTPMLQGLAAQVAEVLLRPLAEGARATIAAMEVAYLQGQPVLVDIPVTLP